MNRNRALSALNKVNRKRSIYDFLKQARKSEFNTKAKRFTVRETLR